MFGPAVLVFVGALLSAIGALWAAQRQQRLAMDSAEQRLRFEQELRAKSDEIAALNRNIAASVTGGNSYSYVNITGLGDESVFVLINAGDYQLYDISVRLVDVASLDRLAKIEPPFVAMTRSQIILPGGNLGPGQVKVIGPFPESWNGVTDFNIFVGARNGFVSEMMRRRLIGGKWRHAIRVTRDGDKQILFEKIDPEYPRNSAGQVDWGT